MQPAGRVLCTHICNEQKCLLYSRYVITNQNQLGDIHANIKIHESRNVDIAVHRFAHMNTCNCRHKWHNHDDVNLFKDSPGWSPAVNISWFTLIKK